MTTVDCLDTYKRGYEDASASRSRIVRKVGARVEATSAAAASWSDDARRAYLYGYTRGCSMAR